MQSAAEIYAYAKRFGEAYAAVMRPLCEELGMAQPAVDILLFLANNPGHDTAREICVCRSMKPGIVSFHVENLVQGGYLERQPMPGDRRKCRLVCTERAEPVIRRGRAAQEQFYERLIAGIGLEALELCRGCLDQIGENLGGIIAEEKARRARPDRRARMKAVFDDFSKKAGHREGEERKQ